MNPARRTTAAASTAVVLATAGTLLTTVTAPASAATTCTSPVFKRQFFANTTFSGTPKKTDCDSSVNESWSGAPASGLPSNNFGVRWSVSRDFGSGGPFTLAASGLDGIRVYVDGVRKIDLWKNTTTTVSKSVNLTIPSGKHTLRVDYVNWTGAAKVKFTYTPRTSATVDKTRPLMPLDALVAYDTATNTTRLSWAKNKEMDLAGYRVYRRVRGSTTWTKVATTTATTATNTPPATGALYHYEVRAYDKAGNESTGTADALVTSIVLQTPAGYLAFYNDTEVWAELDWQEVAGAVKYRVERTDASGAVTVRDVPGAHYIDQSVVRTAPYKYRVAAVDGSGLVSPYTESLTVTLPPAAPRALTATAGEGSATLSWTMRPEDGSYQKFNVYRSTSLPVQQTSAQYVPCTTTYAELPDGSRRFTCLDDSAAEKTTYHYKVVAVGPAQQVSAPSDTVTVTTLSSDKPPAPVTGLTATATEYGIELDWAENTEDDLLRYIVHRGTVLGEEGEEQVCSGSEWAWLGTTQTSYRDVTLPDGQHRCYWVEAQDKAGNISKWAAAATVVAVDELDLSPTDTTPEDSDLTVAARDEGDQGVHVSWNDLSATSYDVYRWNPVSKEYEKLGSTPDRWFYDPTAPRGTTHHYRTVANYADGREPIAGAGYVILEP